MIALSVVYLVVIPLLLIVSLLQSKRPDSTHLVRLLHNTIWIGYGPTGFNPYNNPNPSPESIRKDLERIHQAGFTGIVTYGSRGTLAEIPALAKSLDLAVIMGVWDATNNAELMQAASQYRHVDAYCVGHNGLDRHYTIDDLERVVSQLRRYTGRPVSTSQEIRFYFAVARLRMLGDWLFPDAHLDLISEGSDVPSADVDRDTRCFLTFAQQMASVAQYRGCPLVFKAVCYPHSGIAKATPEVQARFFDRVLTGLNNPRTGLMCRVTIVPLTAFDAPWKREGFYPWDPYTGLVETNGRPRPAVRVILNQIR